MLKRLYSKISYFHRVTAIKMVVLREENCTKGLSNLGPGFGKVKVVEGLAVRIGNCSKACSRLAFWLCVFML